MKDDDILEDDSAGYLISVSDMMSGLLFIFIITLVAFIINFQDAIQKQKEITKTQTEIVKRFTRNDETRTQLLNKLRERLLELAIIVDVDEKHGVLRITEDAVQFETASADLDERNIANLFKISDVLNELIPCYAQNTPYGHNCAGLEEFKGKVDSIFIEGHTDNVPMNSYKFKNNWELSAARAISAYKNMVPDTVLAELLNTNDQPIFSVSGYGEGRPVEGHNYSYAKADPTNRRIDLRFIMTPPSLTDVQKQMKEQGI